MHTSTPRFIFGKQELQARRAAAGVALVMTLSLLSALGQLANDRYDDALMAQADEAPTQVVVVSASRWPA
ncbi:hypothetical protein AACH06_17565 [Ideonella sp. DXS29W]|uniref:Uncharacterized protein n=1 Tax=Ideonella lacteola TaxID=2984193 RepID=A0ABU9BRP2_9BURK